MSVEGRPLRKIAMVNTADEGGGAERIAMATLAGFGARGIDAWLLVGARKTDHPRVLPFHSSPFFDYRPYAASQAGRERRRRIDRWLGLEDFNHPYAHHVAELTGSPPDLVICFNLHGGYFDLRALAPLSRRVPVILRLCDSWLFTGHCAQTQACPRWETGCGRCPDLELPPAISRDATRLNWWRKSRSLRGARLHVSAESEWVLERARKSLLAPTIVGWNLIPAGIDLATFRPGPKDAARQDLGMSLRDRLLLFVANGGAANPYKDFATVRRAVVALARETAARPLTLLVVGGHGSQPDEDLAPGVRLRHLNYVASPTKMAQHYRAANVLLHAAAEEPFGLSVAEALACGTPVVSAAAGGVLETVEAGRTAFVVASHDAAAMTRAIACLIGDPALHARMSAAAAASARARFDHNIMLDALYGWCREVHAGWHEAAARRQA